MPVFLGHKTAELVLDKHLNEQQLQASDQQLEYCWASRGRLMGLDLSLLEGIQKPYDVIVSSRDEIRKGEDARCRLCPPDLPDSAFLEIAPDVFVASPKLCFVLRAQELSLANTVALGSKFCGTYAFDQRMRSGIREREPLTTVGDLRSFIDRCPNMHGLTRARRATSLILPNSASPMETITAIVFCFPRRLGGFGLPLPEMNYEHLLSSQARSMIGKKTIRIDLYWPNFDFGLEYQGKYSHSSSSQIATDIARQLAAERDKIELQPLTIKQIRDEDQRLFVARKIASRLGKEIRTDKGLLAANQRLVDDLLAELGTHNKLKKGQ